MRTQYETETHLKNEDKFKSIMEEKYDCILQKMHKHHIIDFIAIRDNKAVAWIEVKKLNRTFNQHPEVMLSVSKFMKGIQYSQATKLPFLFATMMNDGTFIYEYNSAHKDIFTEWGGRTKNTRDQFDVEPVVKIPIEHFIKI